MNDILKTTVETMFSQTRKDQIMKTQGLLTGCACCPMNRRSFLGAGCAAGAAGLLAAARALCAAPQGAKARIRIVHLPLAVKQTVTTDWPNVGFDFAPVMERFDAELAKGCPEFEFVSSVVTGGPDETDIRAAQKVQEPKIRAILDADKAAGIDGYVVFQLNTGSACRWTIAGSGKPMLYVDFTFGGSGTVIKDVAAFLRRKAANVGFVASSRVEDVVAAVKCFALVKQGGSPSDFAAATARVRQERTPMPGDLACQPDKLNLLSTQECLRRMKESKILAVSSQESVHGIPLDRPIMGIPVEKVPFAEVDDAWKTADKDEARAVADRWQKTAVSIVGVSRETLESSAAMYLGMKAVLKKHGANTITIDCLGGFRGGHIHAYPCLGFYELNDAGLVGACECDLRATSTMVAIGALTGRPGYISDPVLDTAKRQIIYAHCVAPTKPFGPQGATNPFHILTHSEDRKGAAVRSILPPGYMTTTLLFRGWHAGTEKQVVIHQAKAVGNDPDDRACRTKLCAEPVGDIEKLFTEWDRFGWHRVTFYGDLKEAVYELSKALGMNVVEEA